MSPLCLPEQAIVNLVTPISLWGRTAGQKRYTFIDVFDSRQGWLWEGVSEALRRFSEYDTETELERHPRLLRFGVWHFLAFLLVERYPQRELELLCHPRVDKVVAISYPATILLSFIIGMAVERSHSLWVAVTIHAWIDLAIRLRTERTFIVFGVSILLWILLLWRWPQSNGGEAEKPVIIRYSTE